MFGKIKPNCYCQLNTECLEIVGKLLELNIPIHFEKENIDTGLMESELFLSILSGMTANDSASISSNNKWAIQKRFQNGTTICPNTLGL